MTKARDLANFVSTGNPFADGILAVADISDLTASAAELNILDGVTSSTAELNILDGVTATTSELNELGDFAGTFTLPTTDGTNGQFIRTNGSGTLSFATPTAGFTYTLGTAVAPTSGTAIDFTGLPASVKRITVMLSGVGSAAYNPGDLRFRIGDSGGIETTGYATSTHTAYSSTSAHQNSTDSWRATTNRFLDSTDLLSGIIILTNLSGNTWVAVGTISSNASAANAPSHFTFTGAKTLSAVLDRVRLDWSGAGTFAAGTINISYEV